MVIDKHDFLAFSQENPLRYPGRRVVPVMSGPPKRRSKRRNHSLSSLYTKWSFVNAESSTLSVSEVDNNSFCQTVEVKEKKKYCDSNLAP